MSRSSSEQLLRILRQSTSHTWLTGDQQSYVYVPIFSSTTPRAQQWISKGISLTWPKTIGKEHCTGLFGRTRIHRFWDRYTLVGFICWLQENFCSSNLLAWFPLPRSLAQPVLFSRQSQFIKPWIPDPCSTLVGSSLTYWIHFLRITKHPGTKSVSQNGVSQSRFRRSSRDLLVLLSNRVNTFSLPVSMPYCESIYRFKVLVDALWGQNGDWRVVWD